MVGETIKRQGLGVLPLGVLSALLFISLLMMNAATQNSAWFGNLYSLLLVINILGAIILLALISLSLYQLYLQVKARVIGSRMTVRLLGILVLLTVIPVTVVFVFSLQALNRGIDSWFDVKIEQAMDDALNLGRTALDALKQDLVKTANEMAVELETTSDKLSLTTLNYLREQHELAELTLFSPEGRIIASSSSEGPDRSLIPATPDESIFSQIRRGLSYANVDPVSPEELQLRVVVPVYGRDVGTPLRMLQVLQPLPNRYTKLSESVQSSFVEYEKLVYLRGPLKFGFILTLSLVALMVMLIAISGAILAARKLVAPLRDLAEGTQAIARGDYHTEIPVPSEDELGILVRSFNDMTQEIKRAHGELKRSQRETELQRTYLQTILTHLSSGVLSIDEHQKLRTYNAAAEHILGVGLEQGVDQNIGWLAEQRSQLDEFVKTVRKGMEKSRNEWAKELVLQSKGGNRTLILRGTLLPNVGDDNPGLVIVFDDATALMQAQREAAWGEVARRLAHEIKNPLTPIQLSAERIRHKFGKILDEENSTMLNTATNTIIEQVDSLKSMVNTFSDYARPAQLSWQALDLNRLLSNTAELYRTDREAAALEGKSGRSSPRIGFELQLADGLPEIEADIGRMRQVISNLIINAKDSVSTTDNATIHIKTSCTDPDECLMVELTINDNGPGISDDLIDRLFEPYVTGKEKGTGLGLAIVRKIVEEHNGNIEAANGNPNLGELSGAVIRVQLPVHQPPVPVVLDDLENQS
ncbi:MAG: ATP-binding protein [Gammaproteobacteria bacterium]|nr:ATP-binding protein [Gammaproteobacteria bacterium]